MVCELSTFLQFQTGKKKIKRLLLLHANVEITRNSNFRFTGTQPHRGAHRGHSHLPAITAQLSGSPRGPRKPETFAYSLALY